MKKLIVFVGLCFCVIVLAAYFFCPIARIVHIFDDRCRDTSGSNQQDARISLERFQSIEDALQGTQAEVQDVQEQLQRGVRAAIAEDVVIETPNTPQIINQYLTEETIITDSGGDFAYDENTVSLSEGVYECKNDGDVLQWEREDFKWECRTPTHTVFNDTDDTTTELQSDGAIECRRDGHVLMWDKVADHWKCVNPASAEGGQVLTGISVDPNGSFVYTDENGDETVVSIANLETLTSVATAGSVISYLDEDGVTTNIDIADLETTTDLTIDPIAQSFTYTNEDGVTTVVSIAALETLTTLTTLQDGNLIATYTDEDGNPFEMDETITKLVDNGDGTFTFTHEGGGLSTLSVASLETTTTLTQNTDGTFTYINEDGTVTIVTIADLETLTSITAGGSVISYVDEDGVTTNIDIKNLETTTTLTDNPNGTFTYENEDGVQVSVDHTDFTYDASTVVYADGKVSCISDGYILAWDGTAAQWSCADVASLETTTVVTDNTDGTFTFENEDGTMITVDHKDMVFDVATATYVDGKIQCLASDHLLQWDGAQWSCTAFADLEFVTTLVDNANGTYTYTSEDSTQTIIDTKDLDYNPATTTYADGKLQCLTDSHILQWDGTNTRWDCVALDSIDGSVTVTDNADGTFTITVVDPGAPAVSTTVDHKDMAVDGTTALYADGKISCATDDHLLQWDGVGNQWSCVDVASIETTTSITDNADGTFTYINEDGGVGVTVDHKDFSYNAATVNYADGKLQCLTDSHILQWDGTGAQWNCLSLDSIDGSVVITDNADGTFTITVTDPGGPTTTTTIDHKDMAVDGTTALYADGKISCATDEHLLQWDGTGAQWSCVDIAALETTTTITDNADGTFTYLNENGLGITVDHKDLDYNPATTTYADGKLQCLTDSHILQWDGTNTRWDCVALDSIDGSVTVTDNADGTFTITVVDPGAPAVSTTVDHKDMAVDGTTALYADGKISCATDDHLLQWDGAQWSCLGISDLETVTTLADNADGTFTYTSEDNTITIVDTKDLAYDATTVTYTDGKVSCLTDGQILQWDGAGAQWSCVENQDIVTTLADNADGTVTYTSEDGTVTTFDHKDFLHDGSIKYDDGKIYCGAKEDVLMFNGTNWSCVNANKLVTPSKVVDNTDGTITHTAGDGTITTFDHKDFDYDTSVTYVDGKIACSNSSEVLAFNGANWSCVDTNKLVAHSEVTDNADGTITHTSGDGSVTVFDHKDFIFDATSMTYADGKVSCLTDAEVMVWDTPGNQWICDDISNLQTLTTLTDNTDGTFTYVSEDGTITTVDHTDFTYDTTTVDYVDGKVACLTDGHIMKWDGILTQWSCVENAADEICDGDDDTCVYVDQGDADADDIRFVLDGAEHFRMTGSTVAGDRRATLEVLNSGESVFIGEKSGWVDNYTSNKNTFVGYNTGTANTTGDENTYLGHNAGLTNTTGRDNVFVGKDSGLLNTTGYLNTIIGHSAGKTNTIGFQNTFVGNQSGELNTTGRYNSFLGVQSGEGNTTGQYNTAVGYQAGQLNTVGLNNIFVGREAGSDGLGGTRNSGIGYRALAQVTTGGNYNTALGDQAGDGITTQDYNNFIGYRAGRAVSGNIQHSTFIGTNAGEDATGGTGNIAFGYEAAEGITNGTYNSYIGFRSGETADGGSQNSFFGSHAGRNAQSGAYNTALGYYAADNLATGIGNNIFGYVAGRYLTGGNYNTMIGYAAGERISGGTHNQAMGYYAARRLAGGVGNLILGYYAGADMTGGNYSSYIGRNSGQNAAGGSDNQAIGLESAQNLKKGTQNMFVGSYSGEDFDGGNYNSGFGRYTFSRSTGGNYNYAIGEQAARDLSGGSYNLMGGYQAGYSVDGGSHNVMFGYRAGTNFAAGSFNNILGQDAGFNIDNASYNNIFGSYAGQELDGGNYNVFSGYAAGRKVTSADNNVYIGRSAGQDATTGNDNVGLGYVALQNLTTGVRNVAAGQNASGLLTTGNDNLALGYQSGYRNTTGSFNTFVGVQAGRGSNVTGTNNVMLGYRAGYSDAGSNKLFIEGGGGTTLNNSLVYGEFDNDYLKVNGDLEITGTTTSSGGYITSDEKFKKDIEAIDAATKNLLSLTGQSYKYRTDEFKDINFEETRQYGFLAQDVEKVFPHLVSGYDADRDGDDDYKTVNYIGLLPVVVESIREKDQQIQMLTEKVADTNDTLQEQKRKTIGQKIREVFEVVFEKSVTFLASVTFKERVIFADTDSAGVAIIQKGSESVDIVFEKKFTVVPFVTAVSNSTFATYRVVDVSTSGFKIEVQDVTVADLEFTWQAHTKESSATYLDATAKTEKQQGDAAQKKQDKQTSDQEIKSVEKQQEDAEKEHTKPEQEEIRETTKDSDPDQEDALVSEVIQEVSDIEQDKNQDVESELLKESAPDTLDHIDDSSTLQKESTNDNQLKVEENNVLEVESDKDSTNEELSLDANEDNSKEVTEENTVDKVVVNIEDTVTKEEASNVPEEQDLTTDEATVRIDQ